MAYTKQSWSDSSSGGTPISAVRLNHMEDGIFATDAAAAAAQATANNAKSTADTAVTNANTAQTTAVAAQTTANTAVPLGVVQAPGDLIVGTASGAVGRLPALADQRVLEADSTDPLGLKWGRRITVATTAPTGARTGDLWLQI